MSLPVTDMNAMLKDRPKAIQAAERFTAPTLVAMALPMTVALSGWVALWGMSIGMMRAFLPTSMPGEGATEPARKAAATHLSVVPVMEPAPAAPVARIAEPRIVKARPAKAEAPKPVRGKAPAGQAKPAPIAAMPKAEAEKPVAARPSVAEAETPKVVQPVAATAKPVAPEAVTLKAVQPAPVVAAPSRTEAKPAVAVAESAAKPAPAAKPKAVAHPKAAAQPKIAARKTAKGISLAKLSIEGDKPASEAKAGADRPAGRRGPAKGRTET